MSHSHGSRDFSEILLEWLTLGAKILLGLGGLCTVGSLALLLLLCMNVAHDPTHGTQALQSVDIFGRLLTAGVVGVAVGVSYLYWGEDLPAGLLVIGAAALYFAPLYLPNLITGSSTSTAIGAAFGAIGSAGTLLGILGIASLAIQVGIKVRERIKVGIKADQLKFGKGVKEEADRQNVFMGNCWQLPYCRKFVRERCPIYHSKRTCWKERVGCMCEEEVIRNAMENRPIPKDALLAANLIPKNHRLTPNQKFERCKTCVIYNEHQRHKYKLLLPIVVASFILIYGGLHGPLVGAFAGMVEHVNRVVHTATLTSGNFSAPPAFIEGLMFVSAVMLLTYALKALEFVIFKLKI